MANGINWIGIDDSADKWTIAHYRGADGTPAREFELVPSESGLAARTATIEMTVAFEPLVVRSGEGVSVATAPARRRNCRRRRPVIRCSRDALARVWADQRTKLYGLGQNLAWPEG